jgi:hypothetical protein
MTTGLQSRVIKLALCATLCASLMACYRSLTRGTLVLYQGDRRPADQVVRIVKDGMIAGYLWHNDNWSILKDTVELDPAATELRILRELITPGHRPLIQNRRSGSGNPKYDFYRAPQVVTLCWSLHFRVLAGHRYNLRLVETNRILLVDMATHETLCAVDPVDSCKGPSQQLDGQ